MFILIDTKMHFFRIQKQQAIHLCEHQYSVNYSSIQSILCWYSFLAVIMLDVWRKYPCHFIFISIFEFHRPFSPDFNQFQQGRSSFNPKLPPLGSSNSLKYINRNTHEISLTKNGNMKMHVDCITIDWHWKKRHGVCMGYSILWGEIILNNERCVKVKEQCIVLWS